MLILMISFLNSADVLEIIPHKENEKEKKKKTYCLSLVAFKYVTRNYNLRIF